ncbi:MAG: general secretion pathway protein GspK, partial [Burkholderiaceae bacterium]|nr:general secretion pathway protein GspK [Burkholderiaceae bacterium]
VLADSLADWIDNDDYVETNGAESAYYAKDGIRPRNSGIISLDELVRVRGMDAELLERVRPALTVSTRLGAIFVRENASPLALAARSGFGLSSADQRAQAGQRPALSISENANLAGRPLSIVTTVRLPSGASISRVTIVELTGKASPAYQVRSSDWR